MSRDPLFEYWREALCCSLDEAGVTTLTSEQLDSVTNGLLGSRENESMAFGRDCIPNPMRAEVTDLESKVKRLEQEHDARERAWSKAVAGKLRVHHDTSISLNRDGYLEAYNGRTTEL